MRHSRAYRWRDQLRQLTANHPHDPGLLERAIDDGPPAVGSLVSVPLRGLGDVTRADVEITTAPIAPGDYLLFCTNGITDALALETIAAQFAGGRGAQAIVDEVLDATELAHAEDDATAVVVRVSDASP